MTLPRREQRLLDAIDQELTSADPHLEWLLGPSGPFGRLCAGEPLPAREQLPESASRLRSFLWEALAGAAWSVPPLPDPPVIGAAGQSSVEYRPVPPPGQRGQAPDRPGQGRQPGHGSRGKAGNC